MEAIPLCKNLISEEAFWKKIAKLNNMDPSKIPKNLWREGYENLTEVNRDVVFLIKKLKKKYKMAIVSNSIKFHEKINKKRGILDLFDVVIMSHKVALTKDAKDIFLLAARKLKVKPSESIFIDDVKDFVKVAESAGMNGVVFKNAAQLRADLEKTLNRKII